MCRNVIVFPFPDKRQLLGFALSMEAPSEHPRKGTYAPMAPSKHDSGIQELFDCLCTTLDPLLGFDFDGIPSFVDLDFATNDEFPQSQVAKDVSLNAVTQSPDGVGGMANLLSVESLAGSADATDHQPSQFSTSVDLVAPALVSQSSQCPNVDSSETRHQDRAFTIAKDSFIQSECNASMNPRKLGYPKAGPTSYVWSDYINTDVNMPVASLEDLNGEGPTDDCLLPQHVATSLSLDSSTLLLPNAMVYAPMVYQSLPASGINTSQVSESLPPLPLRLDTEPQVTRLDE